MTEQSLNIGELMGDAGASQPVRLDKQTLQALSRLSPWRALVVVIAEWLMIFSTIIITEYFFSLPLYVLAVLFLGTRYHALGVLLHEAAHYRLHPVRRINNWLGEVLTAWPILVTLHGYRNNHIKHHNYTNTDKDPDWVRKTPKPDFHFPKTRAAMLLELTKAITGFRFITEVRDISKSKELNDLPPALKRARLAFYVAVLILCAATGNFSNLLMYWVVPIITSFAFFMYIRSAAEHFGGEMNYTDILQSSRNVETGWLESLCFPHGVNYHLDHHLYPSVPFYNLPKLNAALKQFPAYRERAHVTRGYATGYFKECTTPKA